MFASTMHLARQLGFEAEELVSRATRHFEDEVEMAVEEGDQLQCISCADLYDQHADGYDGECPSCADASNPCEEE